MNIIRFFKAAFIKTLLFALSKKKFNFFDEKKTPTYKVRKEGGVIYVSPYETRKEFEFCELYYFPEFSLRLIAELLKDRNEKSSVFTVESDKFSQKSEKFEDVISPLLKLQLQHEEHIKKANEEKGK